MSPIASVDIGSNAVRMLIGEVIDGGIVRIRYERDVTRLAQDVLSTGTLRQQNMSKALDVLKAFSLIISEYDVRHKKVVGTAALREAANSGQFISDVFLKTGMNVEVIPPEKEAELTAKGFFSSADVKGTAFLVDIGGGSTEWIFCKGRRVLKMGTVPVGVVKLTEKYLKSDPPSEKEITLLGEYLEGFAKGVKNGISAFIRKNTVFIGTAGTASTIASIDLMLEEYDHEKVHLHEVSIRRLKGLSRMLDMLSLKERVKVKGLEPQRADLIIPGIHFTIKLMEILGFEKIIISDCGLPEGLLIELSEEVSRLNY